MTFVTAGLAIAGALAVTIPILIHLLARQRRTPIEWAAMRFLIEAFRKHKRRLQLEQLLLLVVRCLIVALLGFALARPVLEAAGIIPAGGSRAVYVVIDNGMISGVVGEDGRTALQQHIRQAVDLVNAMGPGDAVGVITAARPAGNILAPPSTDRDAVVTLLQSLTTKETPTDLPGAFTLLRSAMGDAGRTQAQANVYLFSEFRSGSAALDAPLPTVQLPSSDSARLFASAPAAEPLGNVQVTSIEPVRSVIQPGADDGSGQITVRLSRTGEAAALADISTVRLAGDALPVIEPRIVRWQPGQSQADVKFQIPVVAGAGGPDRALSLTASIDDDALNADNQRHVVVELRNQIRVLLIDRRSFGIERTLDRMTAGQWIRRALEPTGDVTTRRIRPGATADPERGSIQIVEAEPAALEVADLRMADVAVLPRPDLVGDQGWTALRAFVDRGGLLIITPPGEINVHPWTESLARHLALPWRFSLEVVPHVDGLPLSTEQPSGGAGSELLRLISSDLPELSTPVLAYRVLPVERDPALTTGPQPIVNFADGTPLAVAGSPERQASEVSDQRSEFSPAGGAEPLTSSSDSAESEGLVVYFTVAPELEWTNLPSKPLMVPLFQEIVRQGLSVIRAAHNVQVGEQPNLARAPRGAARDLLTPQGRRIAIEQTPGGGRPSQPLDHNGVYSILDQSEQTIDKIAVNVDSSAGSTDLQTAAAVGSWLNASGPWTTVDSADLPTTLARDHAASPIAGLLLLVVLGLVIAETVMARRFSHAYEGAINSNPAMTGSRRQPLGGRPLTPEAGGAT